MNEILVDSSYVYALYSSKDINHAQALEFSKQTVFQPIIPDVVLPEVTFLFQRAGGIPAVTLFLRNFAAAGIQPTFLLLQDIQRAESIMQRYANAELDFVDCAVVALSERW